jgi:putative methyltransferase (TIGR04325 family)
MLTKQQISRFVPPVLIDVLSSFRNKKTYELWWQGNFENWESARKQANGYDDQLILKRVKESLLKVKSGEAVYERDSVLFDKIQYSWPLLACLQRIALDKQHVLRVLDFGGSLGSSYFQNRSFLQDVLKMEWHVVEQQHFVECGRKNFESNQLHFHDSVNEACSKHSIDCLFLSGVLQYLEKPFEWIDSFLTNDFKYILIDRTSFIDDVGNRLTMQTVPEDIYKASYPCWFFNEKEFLAPFSERYQLIADFDSYADLPSVLEDGKKIYWKGYFLKRK